MNRDDANAILPIIQAFAEGKTIQVKKYSDARLEWRDCEYPKFDCSASSYRIKPDPPKEFWINCYEHDHTTKYFIHETEESAIAGRQLGKNVKTLHVREVE